MKSPIIIGNWKLNGNKKIITKFIFDIQKKTSNLKNVKIIIALPTPYLYFAKKMILNKKILLAAQNVDSNLVGAFTGETSIKMLKDIGIEYVILGHSERRNYHFENDIDIAKKFFITKNNNLIPILCIGEKFYNNNAEKTINFCIEQLKTISNLYHISLFENSIIAYEPIWAIGTGKSANPDFVNEIHKGIYDFFPKELQNKIIIQYGGSINEKNAKDFLIQKYINGLLLGKSSLDLLSFYNIIKIAIKIKNEI